MYTDKEIPKIFFLYLCSTEMLSTDVRFKITNFNLYKLMKVTDFKLHKSIAKDFFRTQKMVIGKALGKKWLGHTKVLHVSFNIS